MAFIIIVLYSGSPFLYSYIEQVHAVEKSQGKGETPHCLIHADPLYSPQ
jgi:hypothetical protein